MRPNFWQLMRSLCGGGKARSLKRSLTRSLAFDRLEARTTPTVTITPDANNFRIAITGGESILLSETEDHDVRVIVNGVNRDTSVLASAVVKMNITATGNFANLIDLSQMRAADYTTLIKIGVNAGGGADTIKGCNIASVAETLNGGDGNDTIYGNAGNDVINGGNGNDTLHGGDGNDIINGGNGNDTIFGENGADKINGGAGADILWGGNGNDIIQGNAGADRLHGGNGNDYLYGDAGPDILWGDAGHDRLRGGAGVDTLHHDSSDPVVQQ